MTPPRPGPRRPPVHPLLERLAAYSWRLIVIGIVVLALLWLASRLRLVLIPVVVALFVSRALSPLAGWLRRHGWRPGLAAVASMVGGALLVAALGAAIVPPLADQIDSVGPTVTEALDDIETWLAEDSPVTVSRSTVDDVRERVRNRLDEFARSSNGNVVDRATIVGEIATGAVLATFLTFFMLRDGRAFVDWSLRFAPERHRELVRRAADRGWRTLGGYLRGAALLGALEAAVIGLALFVGGASLVVPVMILTFVAAFVPIVGAIVASVVAVLVALATGGVVTAVVVGGVALLVQQLDNDLLAPVIYGRTLELHPVIILLSVVAGGALFGVAGTMLAVPVTAVGINVTKEAAAGRGDPTS